MTLAEKITIEQWTYGEGESRIEDLCAYDPALRDKVTRLALRFISEKGLSGEFADVLEEIQGMDIAKDDMPTP
ncbi:hypothetical protein ACEUZ9_001009 [Paracoccus litorisediminis]|uniref:hypothetical protein n=1 Tax=Paracoccus litorisediminis TaxID=2006130 RepID=UPI00372DC2FC